MKGGGKENHTHTRPPLRSSCSRGGGRGERSARGGGGGGRRGRGAWDPQGCIQEDRDHSLPARTKAQRRGTAQEAGRESARQASSGETRDGERRSSQGGGGVGTPPPSPESAGIALQSASVPERAREVLCCAVMRGQARKHTTLLPIPNSGGQRKQQHGGATAASGGCEAARHPGRAVCTCRSFFIPSPSLSFLSLSCSPRSATSAVVLDPRRGCAALPRCQTGRAHTSEPRSTHALSPSRAPVSRANAKGPP